MFMTLESKYSGRFNVCDGGGDVMMEGMKMDFADKRSCQAYRQCSVILIAVIGEKVEFIVSPICSIIVYSFSELVHTQCSDKERDGQIVIKILGGYLSRSHV